MVTDAKDFELLGDPLKMTGYSRPPDSKLTAVTRVLGVCTAVAMLMMLEIGLAMGLFSPFLAQLTAKDSPLPLTSNEVSWVASWTCPGRLLGAIFGSVTVHYFGSKRTILFIGFPLLLCWIFLIMADSAIWLYAANLSHGSGSGIAFVSVPVYLSEVISPSRRGTVVSYAMSGLPLGSLLGNVFCTYLSTSVFTYLAIASTIVATIILLCVPESPYYLVRENKTEAAENAIIKYNPMAIVQVELDSIKHFVSTSKSITLNQRLRELTTPRNRKVGIIVFVLFAYMQFSGMNTVIYYMEIILTQSMVTTILPGTVVVTANVLDVIAMWLSMWLTDKSGRRMVWIVSSSGAGISMIVTGMRFSLLSYGYDFHWQQWLSILGMICFRIFLFVGICSVPSIMVSELVAPSIKNIVVCLANVFAGILSFASTKSYQPLIEALGDACVFYIYGGIMMSAMIFGIMCIPETKGKSLQEIQSMKLSK